jgi:hypothetical protein
MISGGTKVPDVSVQRGRAGVCHGERRRGADRTMEGIGDPAATHPAEFGHGTVTVNLTAGSS